MAYRRDWPLLDAEGLFTEVPQFERKAHVGGLVGVGFCGGGGSSLGLKWAGLEIDFAMNHSPAAIAMHAANCPEAFHYCQDMWRVDPLTVRPGEPIRFMWFSPDCTHFSKAKGGAPVEKRIRDLAWVIVKWMKLRRPDVVAMENVEEFVTWGPLMAKKDANGFPLIDDKGNPILIPDPARKGEYFRAFLREIAKLGYRYEFRQLRAFRFGSPTIRNRLFGQFRCDGQPITWPEPTHERPDHPDVISGKLKPWRTIAECLDWSRKCPSIFLTREEARAEGCNRPLVDNTMARITLGLQRWVLEAERPFYVPITHGGGPARAYPVDAPGMTQTCAPRGEHALIVPHIVDFHGEPNPGRSTQEPAPTMTANSFHKRPGGAAPIGLAGAYLSSAGGSEYAGKPRGADEPINAMMTDNRQCVVEAFVTQQNTKSVGHAADQPGATQVETSKSAVVAATMIEVGYGERRGQEPRTKDLREPAGTQVAGGVKHAAVAVYMAQHNEGNDGHPVDEPLSTLLTAGCHQHAVAVQLTHLRGSGERFGNPIDQPGPTDTAGGQHLAVTVACLVKYYGAAEHGQPVDEPLHSITVKPRFALVTVDMSKVALTEEQRYTAYWVARLIDVFGHPEGLPPKGRRKRKGCGSLDRRSLQAQIDRDLTPRPSAIGRDGRIVYDLGMRMLAVRERYRAQGVPDDFDIDVSVDGKPITATEQGEMCGNMVCPQVAEAIARAALPELREPEIQAAAA